MKPIFVTLLLSFVALPCAAQDARSLFTGDWSGTYCGNSSTRWSIELSQPKVWAREHWCNMFTCGDQDFTILQMDPAARTLQVQSRGGTGYSVAGFTIDFQMSGDGRSLSGIYTGHPRCREIQLRKQGDSALGAPLFADTPNNLRIVGGTAPQTKASQAPAAQTTTPAAPTVFTPPKYTVPSPVAGRTWVSLNFFNAVPAPGSAMTGEYNSLSGRIKGAMPQDWSAEHVERHARNYGEDYTLKPQSGSNLNGLSVTVFDPVMILETTLTPAFSVKDADGIFQAFVLARAGAEVEFGKQTVGNTRLLLARRLDDQRYYIGQVLPDGMLKVIAVDLPAAAWASHSDMVFALFSSLQINPRKLNLSPEERTAKQWFDLVNQGDAAGMRAMACSGFRQVDALVGVFGALMGAPVRQMQNDAIEIVGKEYDYSNLWYDTLNTSGNVTFIRVNGVVILPDGTRQTFFKYINSAVTGSTNVAKITSENGALYHCDYVRYQ